MPDRALPVEVDETRVGQCVSNLVHNAAKFTPSQGGRITVEVAEHGEGRVAVRVRDNGQGIPREMLSQVFELFAQEERSGMGGHSGLGIGLALTRRLIEMHGGQVVGRSEGPGRGAEFEIVLPLVEEPASAEPGPAAALPSAGARVLVVDDNADAAETFQLLLQMQGFSVFTAADGAGAQEAIKLHRPQAVVLDIGLPDMSGYELARWIRQEARLPHRPLLLAVTGWGQARDRERALAAGFDHHLSKPADPDQVAALVQAHLRQRDEQEASSPRSA